MTTGPRIPPLPESERDERARELVEGLGPLNIFSTLVRHPRLFKRWLPLGGVLLSGELPARDRELLILRTAVRCDAPYEWHQHVRMARDLGVSDADIERVRQGPDADGWDAFDATLLRAADELHDSSTISDDTWKALAERYGERQLIEVPMLVGQYHLVAFTLNALGVEIES